MPNFWPSSMFQLSALDLLRGVERVKYAREESEMSNDLPLEEVKEWPRNSEAT